MEWFGIVLGALGGLVGTIVMSTVEILPWKRWGLPGVFEWHENQRLIVRFFRVEEKNQPQYLGIFGLHFINGVLGGVGFYLALEITHYYLGTVPLPLLALVYSFFLWIVTLVPIHKPITGLHPWNHPLGHCPALASLAGHIAYGVILGIFFLVFY